MRGDGAGGGVRAGGAVGVVASQAGTVGSVVVTGKARAVGAVGAVGTVGTVVVTSQTGTGGTVVVAESVAVSAVSVGSVGSSGREVTGSLGFSFGDLCVVSSHLSDHGLHLSAELLAHGWLVGTVDASGVIVMSHVV